MSEPTEDTRTHGEIVLDVVRSGYSPLGDKTWTMQDLADRTGLRPHQVSNAIARIAREAKRLGEEPILRVKTGAKGQYIYWGALKRGRKPKDTVPAATPTEQVPFTDEELADNALLDMNTQLASEDETVVIIDSPTGRLGPERQPPLQNVKPTLGDAFAKIGEGMQTALGDIRVALGPPSVVAVNAAMEAEKTAGREAAVEKGKRSNKIARIRRMIRDLESELHFLEADWDRLLEKERRYDKMTMTMFGFSSNDPYAVDREVTKP